MNSMRTHVVEFAFNDGHLRCVLWIFVVSVLVDRYSRRSRRPSSSQISQRHALITRRDSVMSAHSRVRLRGRIVTEFNASINVSGNRKSIR